MALSDYEKTKSVTLLCYPAKILDPTSTTYNKILNDRLDNLSDSAEGLVRDYLDRIDDLDQKLSKKLCQSGLKRVEFLGEKGSILSKLEVEASRIHLFFGYYPRIVSKGIEFLTHPKRFRRFFWDELGEYLGENVLMKFLFLYI